MLQNRIERMGRRVRDVVENAIFPATIHPDSPTAINCETVEENNKEHISIIK